MKRLAIAAAVAAAAVGSTLALAQDPAPPQPQGTTTTTTTTKTTAKEAAPAASGPELKDVKSRASYIIGYGIGNQFKSQGMEVDYDVLVRAIKDGQAGVKPAVSEAEAQETAKALQQQQMEAAAKAGEANKREGDAFLVQNAKNPGVVALPSGLQYKVIKQGTGTSPKATDVCTVHYEGRLVNGTIFDSSYKRGEPAQFQPTQVIKGWTEALQLMKTGAEWELYVPANLAYREQGRPSIPPNSTLIFRVELIAVNGQK